MAFPLIDLIERHARANPVRPALITPGGAIAYSELFSAIVTIANHFDDRRLPRMARALINIADAEMRLIVFLAAVDYGLIPLLAHVETVEADFGYDLCIASPDPTWRDIPADVMIDQSVLASPTADGRRRVFPERGDDELSFVVETSGTTGRPKLLAANHKSHRRSFEAPNRAIRFRPSDRVLIGMGTATKVGIALSEAALADGAAILSPTPEPVHCLRLINLFAITVLWTTPKLVEKIIDVVETRGGSCPSLRLIRMGGATFTRDLLRRIEAHSEAEIVVGYGTSEVANSISSGRVSFATYVKGYVGTVNPALTVITTGTAQSPGKILLLNDKEHFARTIRSGRVIAPDGPFFEVPDLGYFDGPNLYLVGRSDEVYNYSGHIIAYSLIEQAIEALPSVKEAAVVNGSALGNDQDLIIGVVAQQPLNLEDVRSRLVAALQMSDALAHFRLCQVDEIKRNPQSGKVDRQALVRDYKKAAATGV